MNCMENQSEVNRRNPVLEECEYVCLFSELSLFERGAREDQKEGFHFCLLYLFPPFFY